MTHYRFAKDSDIPALVELAREIHAKSRYTSLAFSARTVWELLERAIPNKQHCVMVAEKDGEFVGVLLATVRQYIFANDFYAQIDVFYVIPGMRGTPVAMQLMGAARRWAGNRDVSEMLMTDTSGMNATGNRKLFRKIGFSSDASVLNCMWLPRLDHSQR